MLAVSEQPPPLSDRQLILDKTELTLLLAEGKVDEAVAYGEGYAERAGWRCHPRYIPWRSLTAIALDRSGRTDEALALAHEELEIARRIGAPGTLGQSLRIVGTLEREQGPAYLEEAVAVLDGSPARLELAKALAALGGRLRRDRRPTDAREPLRRALELAEACGTQPLVDEVRAEIYATGARPRTTALQGVGSLTSSERRVARARCRAAARIARSHRSCTSRRRRSRCTSRASTGSSASPRGASSGTCSPPSPSGSRGRAAKVRG